jgi:hypothetical protein
LTQSQRAIASSPSACTQEEADEANRLTEILRSAGWHKANRSLVIREALECLRSHLHDKSAEDVFRCFLERLASRATSSPKASADIAETIDERRTKH